MKSFRYRFEKWDFCEKETCLEDITARIQKKAKF